MASNVVVRNIERADGDVIAGLGRAGVATVHEAAGRRGLLGPRVESRQDDVSVSGSAVTVLAAPGDNIMLHAAVDVVRPGDIVVLATTDASTDGYFGDLLATSLRAHGAVALVIDAAVRDIATLREMRFPVWSRAVHAQGTVKATPGSVNVPVECAGQLVNPGDVVVADDDGVVIVARAEAADVLAASEARLAKEEEMRVRLEAGELGLDIYGLREKLDHWGVRWVDTPDDA